MAASKGTDAKRAEQVRQLEAAVREVLTSDGFRRWADCRRSFRDYSWANTLMIAHQAPHASRVAGYRAWQKLGRQVRKGERGIRIWAPRIAKVRDENSGEDERRLVGYLTVSVFDVEQTDGEPLPECPERMLTSAEHPDALDRLEGWVRSELGYRLEYVELAGGVRGLCDFEGKRILVHEGLSTDARLSTLAHEACHAQGIGYGDYGRERAEVIVESAACLALATLGLDTSSKSHPYIAAYGEAGGLDALRTDLQAIDRIASAIESAVLPSRSES